MARVDNRYRRLVDGSGPVAGGLLLLGDAAMHTNPTAGRGVSLAFAHVQHLVSAVAGAASAARSSPWGSTLGPTRTSGPGTSCRRAPTPPSCAGPRPPYGVRPRLLPIAWNRSAPRWPALRPAGPGRVAAAALAPPGVPAVRGAGQPGRAGRHRRSTVPAAGAGPGAARAQPGVLCGGRGLTRAAGRDRRGSHIQRAAWRPLPG